MTDEIEQLKESYGRIREYEQKNCVVNSKMVVDDVWGRSVHFEFSTNGRQFIGITINNRQEFLSFLSELTKYSIEDFDY